MRSTTTHSTTLHTERHGEGEPVVLVHGSWTDGATWQLLVPTLAERYDVVTYDRRGHSRSAAHRPGPRTLDEADLVTLIEQLQLGPVHLVGSSYGGSIALGAATRRPDLVRSVAVHEPPLIAALGARSDGTDALTPIVAVIGEVAAAIRCGDSTTGARRFVEDLVLGPGAWAHLPADSRATMIANAATFVATVDDPDWLDVPSAPPISVLLTDGDASPAWLRDIVTELADHGYDGANRHTIAGAGHVPHLTHPHELAAVLIDFLESCDAAAVAR